MAIQIWQPGEKIKNDRFHILKQLGKGGFGITYLAEDTVKKQQIVIKTLNASQQGEADFAQKQENFVKEGFTLKTFNHPNIVKVYEPIQIGDLWGLVMEYIPGQDLADYIIANGRLGEAEALNYIDQIAQALDCVHQQKFFHRDVKPHNIMLRQDRGEAVLIDFGIAKEFVDLETIYLSNSLGTELYKPIEQYEKRGQFGAYTDIYALAVTLYHLLTGAAPGSGSPLYTSKARKDAQDKGWGDKLDEHLWGELAKVGVSERTQAAIKAGMEIDPSQRPQTITEFRQLFGLGKERLVEIESESDCGKNWFKHGNGLLSLGKFEDALTSYDRALEIEPGNDDIWFNRRITLNILGRHEDSINSYNLDLESDPDIWYSRGNMLCKLGRYNEAIASYDRALKYRSEDHDTWYFRGCALDELGRHEDAIDSYNCALDIRPNDYFIWCLRGNALSKIGKYEQAITSYDKILQIDIDKRFLEIDPEDMEIEEMQSDYYVVWVFLGNALEKLDKYEEAIASYDRALDLDPDNPEASEKRQIAVEKLNRTRFISY
jgi:serine/threonine protein kinase